MDAITIHIDDTCLKSLSSIGLGVANDTTTDNEASSSEPSDGYFVARVVCDEYYVFDFVPPSGGHEYVRCDAL